MPAKIAIFIDAENVDPSFAAQIFSYARSLGVEMFYYDDRTFLCEKITKTVEDYCKMMAFTFLFMVFVLAGICAFIKRKILQFIKKSSMNIKFHYLPITISQYVKTISR